MLFLQYSHIKGNGSSQLRINMVLLWLFLYKTTIFRTFSYRVNSFYEFNSAYQNNLEKIMGTDNFFLICQNWSTILVRLNNTLSVNNRD